MVSRLAISSLLILATACPLDAGESNTTESEDDGNNDTTGSGDGSVTLTGPPPTSGTSPTGPSSSNPTTTTMTATDPTTDTNASETEPTDPTDPTTTGDPTTGTTGGPPDVTPTTIPEIQQDMVPVDTFVEVTGAICTAVAFNGFFMQEPTGGMFSGIWVFTGDKGPFPALGDVVTVTGTYSEFFDLAQIGIGDFGDVMITESPGAANVPAPEPLTPADLGEAWESVLVRISGDTYTVVEINDNAVVNEFRVEDGNTDSVWVDDFIYDAIDAGDLAGFDINATFDAIQGPLNYTFMEFKIVPRTVEDLSGYTAP